MGTFSGQPLIHEKTQGYQMLNKNTEDLRWTLLTILLRPRC